MIYDGRWAMDDGRWAMDEFMKVYGLSTVNNCKCPGIYARSRSHFKLTLPFHVGDMTSVMTASQYSDTKQAAWASCK